LADTAQIVFLDQRGNGRSDLSSADHWNLSTWIDAVVGFCEVLGIEQPILLGHSFGGFVALGLAARYPELPAKLIVASSAAQVRYERSLEMFERLGGREARDVAARYFRDHTPESLDAYMAICGPLHSPTPPDPEIGARIIRTAEVGLHFGGGELKAMNLFSEIGRIRCPTLILGGELDPLTPGADLEDLVAAIPGSRLETFPKAGHRFLLDRPGEALTVIREFVGPGR
jgi:proline iminopeptidase